MEEIETPPPRKGVRSRANDRECSGEISGSHGGVAGGNSGDGERPGGDGVEGYARSGKAGAGEGVGEARGGRRWPEPGL